MQTKIHLLCKQTPSRLISAPTGSMKEVWVQRLVIWSKHKLVGNQTALMWAVK